MIRPNTVTNIAAVQNTETVGDLAVGNDVGYAMGQLFRSCVQGSVSGWVTACDPEPAVICFQNLVPESVRRINLAGLLSALNAAIFAVASTGSKSPNRKEQTAPQAFSWYGYIPFARVQTFARAILTTIRSVYDTGKLPKYRTASDTGSWYLLISHAAYVSIVRGLVRLAPVLTMPVRAVSL